MNPSESMNFTGKAVTVHESAKRSHSTRAEFVEGNAPLA